MSTCRPKEPKTFNSRQQDNEGKQKSFPFAASQTYTVLKCPTHTAVGLTKMPFLLPSYTLSFSDIMLFGMDSFDVTTNSISNLVARVLYHWLHIHSISFAACCHGQMTRQMF